MKQEKSCGAIVLNSNNEILLALHNAGHWGFTKGHVEQGETEEQTAIREVKEETNIDIEINTKYSYRMFYSPKEGVEKEVILFLGKCLNDGIKPQLEEIKELKWFSIEDAIKTITFDNAKDVLEQLKKDLKL